MHACVALVPLAVNFAPLSDSLAERFFIEQAASSERALRTSYLSRRGRPLTVAPGHLLDNCSKVYLDMGLNDGNKFFVLYEPDIGYRQRQQPFSSIFGTTFENRRDVCAMGFEPNGNIMGKLHKVRRRFEQRGHRLYIFNAAVATDGGSATLFSDSDSKDATLGTWGKTLVKYDDRMAARNMPTVKTISLAWLLYSVLQPKPGTARPRVLAKMDVEGAEYDLMSFNWPLICHTVDLLLLERHDRFFRKGWRRRVGSKTTVESELGAQRIRNLDIALSRMREKMHNSTKGCRTHVRYENAREANPNWSPAKANLNKSAVDFLLFR